MKWEERFFSKEVSGNGNDFLIATREHFSELADKLETMLPEGRYKALVLTKLEEAAMFASKAFSHHE